MARGRKSKYLHLLRAMRVGDTVYLPATAKRFDRQISGAIYRYGGKASTVNVVGVRVDRATAQHLVGVTITRPLADREMAR